MNPHKLDARGRKQALGSVAYSVYFREPTFTIDTLAIVCMDLLTHIAAPLVIYIPIAMGGGPPEVELRSAFWIIGKEGGFVHLSVIFYVARS
jgi:hypothetical protein